MELSPRPRAVDDLPDERIEGALMMRRFLESQWGVDPGRRWWFNDSGEQADAIFDLEETGYLTVRRSLDGHLFAIRRTA